jgi:hypothetical protein
MTQFTEGMKAHIRAFKASDISTFAHELIHGITPMMKKSDADIIRAEWKRMKGAELPEDWHTQFSDNGDGTYSAEYTPPRAGPHTLRVLCRGADIYGSPFFPLVEGAPTAASHCAVGGDGTVRARVGGVNVITVIAGDSFGEARGVGGDAFAVSVLSGPALLRRIVDRGDGAYDIEYDVDVEHPVFLAAAASGAREGDAGPTVELAIALANPAFPYPRPLAGTPLRVAVEMPAPGAPLAAALARRGADLPLPPLDGEEGGEAAAQEGSEAAAAMAAPPSSPSSSRSGLTLRGAAPAPAPTPAPAPHRSKTGSSMASAQSAALLPNTCRPRTSQRTGAGISVPHLVATNPGAACTKKIRSLPGACASASAARSL